MTGVIASTHSRGFGFIYCDVLGGDVFFPSHAVDRVPGYTPFDDLEPGQRVSFELVYDGQNRPQAQHLRRVIAVASEA